MPMRGQRVCAKHGGRQPAALVKAQTRIEEARARRALVSLGRPEPIEHPIFELLDVAAETRQWQRILRDRLAEVTELSATDSFGVDRERAVVVLYERSLDRVAKILGELAKLDLQTRAMRINQKTAGQVMVAMVEALRRAGLADHERAVREHLAAALQEMTAGT